MSALHNFQGLLSLGGAASGPPPYVPTPGEWDGWLLAAGIGYSAFTMVPGTTTGEIQSMSDVSGNNRSFANEYIPPQLITDTDGTPAIYCTSNTYFGAELPTQGFHTWFLVAKVLPSEFTAASYLSKPANGNNAYIAFYQNQLFTHNGSNGYCGYGSLSPDQYALYVVGAQMGGNAYRRYTTASGFDNGLANPQSPIIGGVTLGGPQLVKGLFMNNDLLSDAAILAFRDKLSAKYGYPL